MVPEELQHYLLQVATKKGTKFRTINFIVEKAREFTSKFLEQ